MNHRTVDRNPIPVLPQLFELQVRRTPDEPAVVYENERLTFSELNVHANRLAHELRRRGVGPEVPVALFMDRSVEMAVGLLGILKAGGAYVPVDLEQPVERQALIQEDCRPRVIVTQAQLVCLLPRHDCSVVCVDYSAQSATSTADDENPSGEIDPGQMAYVIYTSGTTGKPKGVAVEHSQLSHYLTAAVKDLNMPAGGSYAMIQPLAFDSCITSLFPPWVIGGCLHILSRERALDPDRLAAYCERHPIDCLKIAPSHLATLLTAPHPEAFLPRRLLVTGGEAPTWELFDSVHALNPECAIFNHYGPTEATVGVCAWRYNKAVDRHNSPEPPIGRPLGDNRLYILDEHLDAVTNGSVGELYIGGDQLSRGYLNQLELTAERFVRDPFASEDGAMLYRTGDLVRRLADGHLAFVRRRDRQIKIRGFRIELGEIERVLSEHPAIRQAVVETYKDTGGRMRVAAYVVPRGDQEPVPAHLMRFLSQRLPEPMLPSSLVFLEALPELPNGKLDRRSLPHPKEIRVGLTSSPAPPRTPLETALLDIWQEVLGVSPLGVDDDFFELGGNSLIATALLMRVRRTLQRKIPLHTLFEFRTVSALAQTMDDGDGRVELEAVPNIPRITRERVLPLSFAQERVWFIQQTDPRTVAYNYGATLRFEGDLDISALEQSLTEQVRRHEIYRTTIPPNGGQPAQEIHPPWTVALSVLDLSSLDQGTRKAETERQVEEVLRRPFDLTRLPLVRWTLLKLHEETHLLVHVEHHIVHDGWATDLFLQELFDLYNAFSLGRPSPLEDPSAQYGDFAAWQREWATGSEAARQRDFWTRTLAGCQPGSTLPLDRARPTIGSYRGERLHTYLDDEIWQSLCVLGRQEKVTPFMVMLAALYGVLYHYTGQTDINVGTATANRRSEEVAGMLGMLVNNLVLRVDLSNNPSFRELLHRVRDATLAAYENEDLPFQHVVDAVAGPRDLNRNPLYQIMFSFHDTPMPDISVSGMQVTMERSLDTGTAKFDLNIVVYPAAIGDVAVNRPSTSGATWTYWEYNSDLFDSTTIARFVRHHQHLLNKAIADPDLNMSALSPLSRLEQRQLLRDANAAVSDWPRDCTIHQLFEAEVEKTPDKIALVCRDQRLSYRELNRRANLLADTLRDLGVGLGNRVGVLMERSSEMIVAFLGILKAGGAYVPLDPYYPRERLTFMLEDAGAAVLLTARELKDQPPSKQAVVICLDDMDWHAAPGLDSSPDHGTEADSLAYVMYTSGSTGTPKGVDVCHRGVVSLVKAADYARLDAGQTFLQMAPMSFDASTFEVWGALLNGGRCVIIDAPLLSAANLKNAISQHAVTTVWLTAAMFNSIIDEEPRALQGLEQLLIGGEALSAVHVRKARENLPKIRIINGYGPTECTTFACCYSIPRHVDDTVTSIPIGKPVANRTAYILDRDGNPVPVGVPGELYIGGAGVARGYHGQPDLTATRFVPDRFDGTAGAKLFRTGDRARFLADGTIEFLGRFDRQIKLHGYRIEPGEIEAALRRHAFVDDCVVVLRKTRIGDNQLVAYVAAARKEQAGPGALRQFLRQKLPDYAVPAAFVILDVLPLTPNGKVDKQALPSHECGQSVHHNDLAVARNPVEAHLVGIWTEVLGIEGIGVHDDFFMLGGHSLMAMQIINRSNRDFGIELSLIQLFDTPTVASLAELIGEKKSSPDAQCRTTSVPK